MSELWEALFGEKVPNAEEDKEDVVKKREKKYVDILKRMDGYEEDHCWQYDIRLRNADSDLEEVGLTREEVDSITIKDFDFRMVESKDEREVMTQFIRRHEWLGSLSQYNTHWFGAYYKGILAGVIIMNIPNAFSKLLGDNTKDLERLISRGACISWSPKNLASALLMWSIDWMVKNTQYRLFTCYSDPTAKEIGTIYQACNFYYIGQKAGASKMYINQWSGKLTSDRWYRSISAYRIYAKELGFAWKPNWTNEQGYSMAWGNVPDEIEAQLRKMSKDKQNEAECVELPLKHKYAYVKGRDKRETKQLRRLFEERNKTYPYPKERGK